MSTAGAEKDGDIDALSGSVSRVEEILIPLVRASKDTSRRLSQHEEATEKVTLAYAAYSLFYAMLRSRGETTSDHRIKAELARVKEYMIRVKKFGDELSAKGEEAHVALWTQSKPSLKVDVKAASRIVQAALPPNTIRDSSRPTNDRRSPKRIKR